MAADIKSCPCPESDVKSLFHKYGGFGGSDGLDSEDLVAVLRCLDSNMPADKIKAFLGAVQKKGEVVLSLDELYDALFADLNVNPKPCTAQELAEEAEALVQEAAYEFRRAEREIYSLITNLACKNAQDLEKGTTSSQESQRVILTSDGEIVPLPLEQAPIVAPPPPTLPHDLCTSNPPQPPEGDLRPLYVRPDEPMPSSLSDCPLEQRRMPSPEATKIGDKGEQAEVQCELHGGDTQQLECVKIAEEMAEDLAQEKDIFRRTREMQSRIAQDLTAFLQTQIEEVGRNEEHARRVEMALGATLDERTPLDEAEAKEKTYCEEHNLQHKKHSKPGSISANEFGSVDQSCLAGATSLCENEVVDGARIEAEGHDKVASRGAMDEPKIIIEAAPCDIDPEDVTRQVPTEMQKDAGQMQSQHELLGENPTDLAQDLHEADRCEVDGKSSSCMADDQACSRAMVDMESSRSVLIQGCKESEREVEEHQRKAPLPVEPRHSCESVSHCTSNDIVQGSNVRDNLAENALVESCDTALIDVSVNAGARNTVTEIAVQPRPQEECLETGIAEEACKLTATAAASTDSAEMQQVPCSSAVSVTGTTKYHFCLGTYTESSIPPVAQHGRRVIFKGPNAKYLFYWCEVKRWMIGDDYASCRAWLCSATCDCWSPTQATQWREWDASSCMYQPLEKLAIYEVNVVDELRGRNTVTSRQIADIILASQEVSLPTNSTSQVQESQISSACHDEDGQALRDADSRITDTVEQSTTQIQSTSTDGCAYCPEARPYLEVPCDEAVTVKGTQAYAMCVGTYARIRVPACAKNGGRAVFRGPNSRYLYYWQAASKWLVGDDYQAHKANLCSDHDEGWCPSRASGWREWDASAGQFKLIATIKVQKVTCKDAVTITGIPSFPMCVGTYVRTEIPPCESNARRAIFKGPGAKYLFYWRETHKWLIGDDYTACKAWVCSAHSDGWWPSQASEWREWNDTRKQFNREDSIKAHKVTSDDVVVSVAGTLTYPLCVGTYVMTDIQPCESNDGRQVFKGPGAKYLFYWRDTHKWLIGDDYKARKAWLCSAHDDNWCPSQASAWREWDDLLRQFKPQDSIKVHKVACEDVNIVVTGSSTYPLCLGNYVLTDIPPCSRNAGRAIFKGPGTKYLFYWRDARKWLIGDDYKMLKAWLCSASDESWCPSQASAWREWDADSKKFKPNDAISVQEVRRSHRHQETLGEKAMRESGEKDCGTSQAHALLEDIARKEQNGCERNL